MPLGGRGGHSLMGVLVVVFSFLIGTGAYKHLLVLIQLVFVILPFLYLLNKYF